VSVKLNEASSAHKRKLCERYVEQRWGITFERFLTRSKSELTAEVRNRIWHDLGELEFDCDLIVVGFTSGIACLLGIQSDGEVIRYENFAAIGTGKLIAESVLFQREQQNTDSFRRTLYNVYEAARLGRIAPGVGETDSFIMLAPPVADDSDVGVSHVNRNALHLLEEAFEAVGPKALTNPPEITDEHFDLSDWGNIQTAKGLEVIIHGSKPPRNP
jgi:hypothetical protein